MSKEIKDFLHLYLGCEVEMIIFDIKRIVIFKGFNDQCYFVKSPGDYADTRYFRSQHSHFKPILRPLSDMTEEELIEVIQSTVPDDMEDKPTPEDYDLEMFYNDGGNMVDGDVVIGANYSCCCYEGQIAIKKCGSIDFYNEGGELERQYNMPKVYLYLLSKHFDLFNLISEGLAIDATTLK